MPTSTPFDNVVQVTWNVEQVIRAQGDMLQGLQHIDRTLLNTANVAERAFDRMELAIQGTRAGAQELLADLVKINGEFLNINRYGSSSYGSQAYGFSNTRLNDNGQPTQAMQAYPGPGSGVSQADWEWAQRRIALGSDFSRPYSASMSIAQGAFSQGMPIIPSGYPGGWSAEQERRQSGAAKAAVDKNAEVEGLAQARLAVATQDYEQYRRIIELERQIAAGHEAAVAEFLALGQTPAQQRQLGMEQLNYKVRGSYPSQVSGTQYDAAQSAAARDTYEADRQRSLAERAQVEKAILGQEQLILDEAAAEATAREQVAANDAMLLAYSKQQVAKAQAQAALQPVNTAGLTGNALQYGIQQNLAGAQTQMGQAWAQMQQGVPGAAQAFQTAANAAQGFQAQLQQVNTAQQAQVTTTTQSTSAFLRHTASILSTVAIYQTLHAVVRETQRAMEEAMQIESAQARVGFVNGQSRQDTLEEFNRAARYGLNPNQAAPGIITSAQTQSTDADKEFARQEAMVFGAEQYTNILQENMQTQARANAVGLDSINISGFMAEAYKVARLEFEQYNDALQMGIELQSTLGLGAERAGLAIVGISKATEQSPEQVSNIIERVRLRLDMPETAGNLKRFGIQGGDTAEMLRSISAAVAEAASRKDFNRSDDILQGLVGGLAGPQTLRELRTVMVELNRSFTEAQKPLGDFRDLTKDVGETGQVAFDRLKASWDLLLASLTDLEPIVKATNGITGVIAAQTAINQGTKVWEGMSAGQQAAAKSQFERQTGMGIWETMGLNGKMYPQVNVTDKIAQENGIETNPLLNPLVWLQKEELGRQLDAQFYKYLGQGSDRTGLGEADYFNRQGAQAEALPPGRGMLTPPKPPQFGGFQELPENFNWEKFQADIKKYSAQLTKEVPGYEQNPQEVAFWDGSKNFWRTQVVDNAVMQRALQEQTDTLKQITGIFNVPAGGEVLVPFFALQAGMVPSTYGGGGKGSDVSDVINGRSGGSVSDSRNRGALNRAPAAGTRDYGLDAGQQGVMGYLAAHGYDPASRAAAARPVMADDRQQAIQEHRDNSLPTINVSLRNTVVLNSRVIYSEMIHEMQAQMTATRRGLGGGTGSHMMAS